MRLIVYFVDGGSMERIVSDRDNAMLLLFSVSRDRTVLTYKITGA